ncbi:MAG: hypothetical protein ACLUKN_17015 [Bacilli bacterium]
MRGIEYAGDLDPVLVSLSDKFSVEIDSVSRSFGACLSDTGQTPFFKSKTFAACVLEGKPHKERQNCRNRKVVLPRGQI